MRRNGRIGVYDDSPYANLGKYGWRSWVNYKSGDVQSNDNKNYAMGYLVAHEVLHQLLGIASYHLYGDGHEKYHHHSDGDYGINLNSTGRITPIPQGPSKSLSKAETILPHLKMFLNFYIDHEK